MRVYSPKKRGEENRGDERRKMGREGRRDGKEIDNSGFPEGYKMSTT